jgi:hypothetical protein
MHALIAIGGVSPKTFASYATTTNDRAESGCLDRQLCPGCRRSVLLGLAGGDHSDPS